MKFTTSAILATIFSLPAVFSQTTYKVTYNQYYDDGSNSLSTVACSNGENGLLTKGRQAFIYIYKDLGYNVY